MARVTVNLPDYVAEMPEQERDLLIRAGLYEAMHARRQQLAHELAEAEAKVHEFERKYNRSLTQFEADVLPDVADLDTHNDYNDWFYFNEIVARLSSALAGLDDAATVDPA